MQQEYLLSIEVQKRVSTCICPNWIHSCTNGSSGELCDCRCHQPMGDFSMRSALRLPDSDEENY